MDAGKFLTWQVGDVRITRVAELAGLPFPGTFMFPACSPEMVLRHAWLRPHFAEGDGRLLGSIHSFHHPKNASFAHSPVREWVNELASSQTEIKIGEDETFKIDDPKTAFLISAGMFVAMTHNIMFKANS